MSLEIIVYRKIFNKCIPRKSEMLHTDVQNHQSQHKF